MESLESSARERDHELRTDREAHDEFASAALLAEDLCESLTSSLTSIVGECDRARTAVEPAAHFDRIASEARNLLGVLSGHRRVTSKRSGGCVSVNLRRCAEIAVDSMRRLADERDVTLHLLVDNAPELQTDPVVLAQAVRQVLRVSIVSSRESGGDVTLALGLLPVEGAPTHLGVCIADDGPGFDLKRGASRRGSAGYTVVEAMARALGGEIIIDSTPGKGTRATLKLPLKPKLTLEPVASRVETIRAGSLDPLR